MPDQSGRDLLKNLITTFYNFKGGVGCSLLLANVAAALAGKRKVLIWDLDVEAPGLHHLAALTPNPKPESGFLEWLKGWQEESIELLMKIRGVRERDQSWV
ncbi:MAG: hypothetical protein HQL52_12420, partial [Magnetococcales bacterium]|nr:hypothetical protein [Magnetococcales bacterium]